MSGWRAGVLGRAWSGPPPAFAPMTVAMMALRPPPERMLTAALRSLGRRRPEMFERLGPANAAALVVAPTDFPVAFRLHPDGGAGEVEVVRVLSG